MKEEVNEARERGAIYRNENGKYDLLNVWPGFNLLPGFFAKLNLPPGYFAYLAKFNLPHGPLCDCCGRQLDELPPFGGPEDPLGERFTGAVLLRFWRPSGRPSSKAEKYFGHCESKGDYDQAMERLRRELGEEEAESLLFAYRLSSMILGSWECRDCVVLNDDDYFDVLVSPLIKEGQCRLTPGDDQKDDLPF